MPGARRAVALAKKCQDLLDERAWHIRGLGSTNAGSYGGETNTIWFEGAGSAGLAEKLYVCAAEATCAVGR